MICAPPFCCLSFDGRPVAECSDLLTKIEISKATELIVVS